MIETLRFIIPALALLLAAATTAVAQQDSIDQSAAGAAPGSNANPQGSEAVPGEVYGKMLQVPVSTLFPGAVSNQPKIKIPTADSAAAQRGMKAFNAFNCVGCHMGNGGGGMGPAL